MVLSSVRNPPPATRLLGSTILKKVTHWESFTQQQLFWDNCHVRALALLYPPPRSRGCYGGPRRGGGRGYPNPFSPPKECWVPGGLVHHPRSHDSGFPILKKVRYPLVLSLHYAIGKGTATRPEREPCPAVALKSRVSALHTFCTLLEVWKCGIVWETTDYFTHFPWPETLVILYLAYTSGSVEVWNTVTN